MGFRSSGSRRRSLGLASGGTQALARSVGAQRLGLRAIPLESQPFHADLLKTSQRWREAPIGQVVGESPRDTLLNFYVVMAKVYDILEELVAEPAHQPGLFWSAETLERAQDANDSLQEAISALDVQSLPRSIRDDLAMEYALKLKKLLDYSFIHAQEPFDIPDRAEMARLWESHPNRVGYWRIPGTSIALSDQAAGSVDPYNYYFSAETIAEIPALYEKVKHFTAPPGPFFTPNFYQMLAATPGYILPPKWYLMLPVWLRVHVLERMMFGQSLAQLVLALLLGVVFLALAGLLLGLLLRTYHQTVSRHGAEGLLANGRRIDLPWLRVLLIGLVFPLAWITQVLIDDYVNITGGPLPVALCPDRHPQAAGDRDSDSHRDRDRESAPLPLGQRSAAALTPLTPRCAPRSPARACHHRLRMHLLP